MTTMHWFMFLSSIFNGILVAAHLTIYYLHEFSSAQAEAIKRFKQIAKSRRTLPAVVRLQRAYRRQQGHRQDDPRLRPESPDA